MTRAITLTDLDGVHFQSQVSCPVNLKISPAALGSDFLPSAFSTPKQTAFLRWLMGETCVVPVTARPVESFKRVLAPFKGYAICSFGGVILTPEGTPEPTWHALIEKESQSLGVFFSRLKETIEECWPDAGTTLGVTIIRDAGCDLYINCKLREDFPTPNRLGQLHDFLASLKPLGWQLHVNGNNFALLPPFLSKERAVNFYLSELAPEHTFVLGIGDSRSDLAFMALCDYAIAPSNSQIFALLKCL